MYKIIFPLIFFLMTSFISHKFYVSNTLIEHNTQSQSYQITCKIFTDDLELAIGGDVIHIGEGNEVVNCNALIENYINAHFKLWYNEHPQLLSFIGKEVENDLTYCYFEMQQQAEFNVLKIESSLLLELFPDQKNIVELSASGKSQTMILTKDKTMETVFH